MSFVKQMFRKHIHHKFHYSDHGGIEKLMRKCPYCKQSFVRLADEKFTWYEPTNGVIVDPNCTCHNWKDKRLR